MKRQQFLIKNHHKIDDKFSRQRFLDPDPVCPKRLDPVCPERLDPYPDPVNIRPDPQPWSKHNIHYIYTSISSRSYKYIILSVRPFTITVISLRSYRPAENLFMYAIELL